MADVGRYPVPADRYRHEIEVRRSRFLASIAPATTVRDAKAFIDEIRAEFASATHNCWAYLVGPPGSSGEVGMSDGGEPHGTAGRPMLAVLTHAEIGDVVVVVTRWFGGTKLGRGGLGRAYADAVQAVIEGMPRAERIAWRALDVEVGYAAHPALQRMLPAHEAELVAESFDEAVHCRVRLPEERVADFEAAVTHMSNGSARVREVE